MANFPKWPPFAILDFEKLKMLTSSPVQRPNMRHLAKYCKDRLNRSGDMADFRFFMMAAVRHLGFSKVGNFNFRSHSEAQYASSYQIPKTG